MTPDGNSRTDADDATEVADPAGDDPATTNQLLHRIAVGLTRLQLGLEKATERAEPVLHKGRERLKEGAERAGPAMEKVGEVAAQTGRRAQATARSAAHGATEAVHATAALLDRARSRSLGLALQAELQAEHAAENLREMSNDLANRGRAAGAAGVDFFSRHREEIIALVITAAKVAAVIGIRRLSRPHETEDDDTKKTGGGRRVVDAVAIVGAVVTHVGQLLARNPSALPLLREMYRKGNPSEQAVVGMLVGPALGSDPHHAADVVREFLEDATSEAAADTIARRTLTPLMRDNPELLEKVLPWMTAASAYVKRAALIALARQVGDRHSRFGDIVAASVVVLEDHDHEVREALGWLLASASEVDLDQVAHAVRDRLARLGPEKQRRARELVAEMPDELQARIEALEAEDE